MGGFFTPEGWGMGFALQNAALRDSGAGFALKKE
jgi:hypothetical protein